MKKLFIQILLCLMIITAEEAVLNANNRELNLKQEIKRRNIKIPNIDGYQTLKGDFHIHTVFSDGLVWPTIRVQECWAEGLDVMAISDHIEYRPHRKYMRHDHNDSYKLAAKEVKNYDIILIKAAEITRRIPPGHLNAYFIKNANKLSNLTHKKTFTVIQKQNALLVWNHPCWKEQQRDSCLIYDIHRELISKGVLQGMEVMNENEWYPTVLQWCLDYNLAVFASSDIHGVSGYFYDLERSHRPMTLLFVKERSIEGVREAIESARTLAWFDQQLAGPEELIMQLFKASVKITFSDRTLELNNRSDLLFTFINKNSVPGIPAEFKLQPEQTILFNINSHSSSLIFTLKNCHTGVFKNPDIEIKD